MNSTSARPFSESTAAGQGVAGQTSARGRLAAPGPRFAAQAGAVLAGIARPELGGDSKPCTRTSRRSRPNAPQRLHNRTVNFCVDREMPSGFWPIAPGMRHASPTWLVVARGLTQLLRLPLRSGGTTSSQDPRIPADARRTAFVSLPRTATTCRYRSRNPYRWPGLCA